MTAGVSPSTPDSNYGAEWGSATNPPPSALRTAKFEMRVAAMEPALHRDLWRASLDS
jgi:hypothetical protein